MGAGDGVTRRLFFAIDLDEASRAAIAELIERLSRRLESDPVPRHAGVKWVERENLHMTVRFLGATPEGRAQELEALMGRPLSSRPFILGFDRVGTFPERGAPRVVWLGASIGAAEAVRARDELEERLGTIDVPPESRPFRPHLTLGRFREMGRGSDGRAIREVGVSAFDPVHVDHLTLYESHLSPRGPRYVPLLRLLLGGDSR
jgi:RNA 2',3'-cyclic 3'-phosphodiesterase